MALPKLLIRSIQPCIFLLGAALLYSAYQQVRFTEQQAIHESKRNLQIAEEIVDSQLHSAASKLYLLQQTPDERNLFDLARTILDKNIAYTDIMLVDETKKTYLSFANEHQYELPTTPLSWRLIDDMSNRFWLSSLYQTREGDWAIALKHDDGASGQNLWIQFDLQFTASRLDALKTLTNGYLFIVEKSSGLLVIHPNTDRIGTSSISYHSGIAEKIGVGVHSGQHEYYYQGQFKLTQFKLDEQRDWAYVSGTERQEILAASHQFALAGIVLIVLLLSVVSRHYLLTQLNNSLQTVAQQHDLTQFKQTIKALFDRFFFHRGMTFCIYDSDHQLFQTLDYHGNLQDVIHDESLGNRLANTPIQYLAAHSSDAVAKKLRLTYRHYVIPLKTTDRLLGVIYLQTALPVPYILLCTMQIYCEVSLANLLLTQKLESKDVMTQLDNKLTIRDRINENLTLPNTYFAMLDIDHFKSINDLHGHLCGDRVIIQTAKMMENCFQKPGAISLARYGGEEFCLLFKANNEHDAYDQCESLRLRIEQTPAVFENQEIRYTVSIGITQIRDSQHITIGRADKSLYQAKGLGRNQVVLNTFE
ncbi:diguanylate cyclase [Vibrio sp. FNV 38]|nr:diguanylate cyclase [Vibrio sp. FNV 38]